MTQVKNSEHEKHKEIQKNAKKYKYIDGLVLTVLLPRRYVRKAIPFVSDWLSKNLNTTI